MNVVAACVSLAVFMGLLKVLRVDAAAMEVLAISRRATKVLRSPRLNDDVKEKMTQRYSLRLLGRFFGIVVPCVIAGGAAFVVLILMDALSISTLDDSTAVLTDWVFVMSALIVTLVAVGTFIFCRRRLRTRHEV